MLEQGGKECSEAFEDVGHSTDAREMMQKYLVGEIIESEKIPVKQKTHNWSSPDQTTQKDR